MMRARWHQNVVLTALSFNDRLKAEVLVADGATGTSYQQMGMAIGIAPEAPAPTSS